MSNIIFLDIDGVLNHQLFYQNGENGEYDEDNIDKFGIELLNELCQETNSKVVISSSWRKGRTLEYLQKLFKRVGATFEIIDKTPISDTRIRGIEVREWTEEHEDEFDNYVIIDDDSDFLIWQQHNLFLVDNYCGLTPNVCYRIRRFLTSQK